MPAQTGPINAKLMQKIYPVVFHFTELSRSGSDKKDNQEVSI
jgi:hypothetical protein